MIGSHLTKEYTVAEENLACAMHSGSLPVLATPWVVNLFEATAAELAQTYLPEGETTVGFKIAAEHLAPTLTGSKVLVNATLPGHEGRSFQFTLEAHDEAGLIATATHERVAVQAERFLQKARARKDAANA